MMGTLAKTIVYDLGDNPAQSKNMNPKDYDIDVLPYYIPENESDTRLVF
jgi:hypothetical protein